MSGCANLAASGTATEAAICRELGAALPTYHVDDTERTKEDGARYLTLFRAVCG